MNEERDPFSKLFFFLSLITNRKEKISNVSLHATDNLFEDFEKWNPSSKSNPKDLEMIGEKKKIAHEVVLSALKLSVAVLKLSVTISSLNIITNADYVISKMKVESGV